MRCDESSVTKKAGFLVTDEVRRKFRNQKEAFLVTDEVRRREVAACEGAEESLAHRNAAKKGWPEAIPFEVLVGLKTIRNPCPKRGVFGYQWGATKDP